MKMCLMKQPNDWSCLPTSLAIVLSGQVGLSVKCIIDRVGHDGSEICWPELPEPQCRRCFTMQEMIDVAEQLGYILTPIDALPTHGPSMVHTRLVYPIEVATLRLGCYMKKFNGILIGQTAHAVVWNKESGLIYDPVGTIYHLETFAIRTLWCVIPIYR